MTKVSLPWNRFRHGLKFVVLVAAVNTVLVYAGCYRALDLREFDRVVQSVIEPDTESPDIVLVTIDDEDYEKVFAGKSPLNQEKVIEIINAIMVFRPKILGIDLLTHEWDNHGKGPLLGIDLDTRFVWAAAPRGAPDETGLQLSGRLPWGLASSNGICVAIPLFQPDDDGTISALVSSVRTTDMGVRPSFPFALNRGRDDRALPADWHERACKVPQENTAGSKVERIRFTGEHHKFRRIRASSVTADAADKSKLQITPPVEDELRGKLVILGGTFSAARDRFNTPAGQMDGLEILAHAVQSLNDGRTESPLLIALALEIGLGAAALALLLFVPKGWDWALVVVSPVLLAVPVSYLAFNYFGSFLSVAASFLGIPAYHILKNRSRRSGQHATTPATVSTAGTSEWWTRYPWSSRDAATNEAADVFISFKNLDTNGRESKDCLMAKTVAVFLRRKALKVFISLDSLEQLGQSAYMDAIETAMQRAGVLIAVGTSVDNLTSRWVKHEWHSFHQDIVEGHKPGGEIFTVTDGMLHKDLPMALRHRQVFAFSEEGLETLARFVIRALSREPSDVSVSAPRPHEPSLGEDPL